MSEKSIVQKLTIKPGRKVLFVNPPKGYEALLGNLPENVTVLKKPIEPINVIQVFVTSKQELEKQLKVLKPVLAPKGTLWVTYPKGTSKIKTDINRDIIRKYAESIGLKAVAMFAVDEVWSALRLKAIK